MSVDAITSTTSTVTGQTKSSSSTGEIDLGKDEFLKLLIAQLEHQDPLDPMDNTEYIAQLATFTELEQMTNLNTNFENFALNQNIAQASSMIGKNVVALDGKEGEEISGVVESISIEEGEAFAKINDTKIPFANIREISLSNTNE